MEEKNFMRFITVIMTMILVLGLFLGYFTGMHLREQQMIQDLSDGVKLCEARHSILIVNEIVDTIIVKCLEIPCTDEECDMNISAIDVII